MLFIALLVTIDPSPYFGFGFLEPLAGRLCPFLSRVPDTFCIHTKRRGAFFVFRTINAESRRISEILALMLIGREVGSIRILGIPCCKELLILGYQRCEVRYLEDVQSFVVGLPDHPMVKIQDMKTRAYSLCLLMK